MKLSETERKLEALIKKTTTQKQKSSELLKEANRLRDQAKDLDNKCLRWYTRKKKIKINLLKHFLWNTTLAVPMVQSISCRIFDGKHSNFLEKYF